MGIDEKLNIKHKYKWKRIQHTHPLSKKGNKVLKSQEQPSHIERESHPHLTSNNGSVSVNIY